MTKMSSLNYMELCRLCLVKEKVSVPIFEGEGGERQIFDKIATCLPVKVSQDDKLPKKICSDCVYRVENSYQFWNTTSNSEKQLLEWVVSDDVKVDTKSNITMETEQLVLKEETIDHDQTAADVAKSLSRVEAVLTEETGQPGGGVSEEEEEEEDSDDGGGGGGGEDSNSEESGEEPPGKEEIESEEEEEEEEPYEELEPTTFVNVSLACDEAGPSGIQQTRQQTKQDSQASAASASATTENAEAPSTSAADPAASGSSKRRRFILPKRENGTISNVSPHLTKNTKASSFKRKASLSVTSNDKPKDENIAEGPLVNILDCLKVSFDEISTPLRKKPLRPLKSLACEFCDKVCLNRKRLNHHVRIVHSNFRYTCDICSKEYKNKGTLDMHKKTHSGGSENYVCDMCNFTTPWKTSMTIHRRRHLGKTSFQCDLCDKAYYKKCELEQHKYVHNTSKPYQCDVCGASYMQKHTLWQHTQSKHSADAPQFPCPHCGRLYIFKSKLKSHIKTHLGFRPYICDICGKSVATRKSLSNHKAIHMNEKTFKCDLCPKAFNTTPGLKLHKRSHTGEKPYLCKECGKRFTQRSTLVVHMRYHLGERPYMCHICTKGFVTKTILKTHLKKHG